MTLDGLRTAKRDAILAIGRKHGVTRFRVFGSFGRGDAREDSDLDLLIDAGLHPLIREEVLREAVPL